MKYSKDMGIDEVVAKVESGEIESKTFETVAEYRAYMEASN